VARIVALVLVVSAAAAAAAVAFAAQSPRALRASIFAVARKQHSAHYVERGAAGNVLRQTMVADVAGKRGIQRIAFTIQGKNGLFTVIVVNRLAYVRGNAFALQSNLGFTPAQAAQYDGRWISVPPGNAKYKDLAASVTLPSFLHDIYPTAPLGLATTTLGKRKITGVRGINREAGLKFVEALFPDSKLRPLGVSDIDASKGFVDAIRISRWNERVHVTAPANAVPISTIQTAA
jgi:hypothetical protein